MYKKFFEDTLLYRGVVARGRIGDQGKVLFLCVFHAWEASWNGKKPTRTWVWYEGRDKRAYTTIAWELKGTYNRLLIQYPGTCFQYNYSCVVQYDPLIMQSNESTPESLALTWQLPIGGSGSRKRRAHKVFKGIRGNVALPPQNLKAKI